MRWKTFNARLLYQDENNICVFDNHFFRWLTFGNHLLQSMINLWFPSRPALTYIPPFLSGIPANSGEILMLGLGGGGVLHTLAPKLKRKGSSITVIENDETIISLAYQYFYVGKIPNLTIYHEDAFSFLNHDAKHYAHILIDIHGANTIPTHCINKTFITNAWERLKINGRFSMNLATRTDQVTLIPLIQEVFSYQTHIIPIQNSCNVIVCAEKLRPVSMID